MDALTILRQAGVSAYVIDPYHLEEETIVVNVALLWHGAFEEDLNCRSWNEARAVARALRSYWDAYDDGIALDIILSEQYAECGGATGYATDEQY